MKDDLRNYKELINQWINDEKKYKCGKEISNKYIESSFKRFKYLVNLCISLKPYKSIDILDVGRSHLSVLLSKYYTNLITLGFGLNNDDGGHRELEKININHITFDLNDSKNVNIWSYSKRFDLIVFSEVIEHLYEAPEFSLLFLKYLLKPGGLLICSTPNAVAIHKRLRMFFGLNPFEKIRFYSKNPGHFREYTKKELIDMGEKCGFYFVNHKFINTLTYKGDNWKNILKKSIFTIITTFIPFWRILQVIIFKKL